MEDWDSQDLWKIFNDDSKLIFIGKNPLRRLLMLTEVDKNGYLHSAMKDNFGKTFWMKGRREIDVLNAVMYVKALYEMESALQMQGIWH